MERTALRPGTPASALLLMVFGVAVALLGITAVAQHVLVSAHFTTATLNAIASADAHLASGFVNDTLSLGSASTSYVERHNLSMRMGMRRFTRLTNAFSKKVENHAAAVSLNMMWMNFGRPHKSLADPYPRTPAMAAGVADHVWTCEEIAALLD